MHHSARGSTTSRDAARLAKQRRGSCTAELRPSQRARARAQLPRAVSALTPPPCLATVAPEHHGERGMASDEPEWRGVAGEGV